MITLRETATKLDVTGEKEELDRLDADFRFRPNGYFYAPSYERWRITDGAEGWDGWMRPLKRLSRTQAVILRGRRDELIALCQTHGFELNLTKLLPKPFSAVTVADIPPDILQSSFLLDEFQRICVTSWLLYGIGINQVTVSGGKTAMFAAATAMIKQKYGHARFLYLTPAERLVRQVVREMRKFLPTLDIGQFGGGHHESNAKDVVVCTVAMLNKHFSKLTEQGWFRTFHAVLYDEVHHCGSKSSEKILLGIPAYFRLGASDSAKEDDPARNAAMRGHFGNFLNEVKAAPLIERGRIAQPHIYVEDLCQHRNKFEDFGFRAQPNSPAWCLVDSRWVKGTYLGPVYEVDEEGNVKKRQRRVLEKVDGEIEESIVEESIIESGRHRIKIAGEEHEIDSRWCLLQRAYDEAIIRFRPRNDLIVKWARYFSSCGHPTIIVCTRTLHIYILEAALKAAIDPSLVDICFGWASPVQRDEKFAWFRKTPGAVLITPLVKEGVSINEIKAGIVADYVGSWEVANQIVGRFIRKKVEGTDNWAEIVWFRDAQHPVLRRGGNSVLARISTITGYVCYDPAPDVGQLLLPLGSKGA